MHQDRPAISVLVFHCPEMHPLGPSGPYATFGGKDASRGLATFSVTSSDKEYDDLSDLNSMEMESVKEWEAQFRARSDSRRAHPAFGRAGPLRRLAPPGSSRTPAQCPVRAEQERDARSRPAHAPL
ncbi:uncharacterized protein LOC133534335 [Cydia pomonella]|uniref:uncharacterized protein LOC133534335 n=1 Tax=Cydia pomonella TaxID=82600 RepID=UPI002ADDBB0F|nr:uncharacterized protein LOC133534335 [Cydia pomonella]